MQTEITYINDWRVINGELRPFKIPIEKQLKLKKRVAWNKGKKWADFLTPEQIERQKEAVCKSLPKMHENSVKSRKGKPACNSIPVLMMTISGKIIGKFYSSSDAERKTKILARNIRKVCTGERRTAGGFVWKYLRTNV